MLWLWDNFWLLMQRGRFVMWPLLLLSVVGLTLVFERCWFWLRTNGRGRLAMVHRVTRLLREGQTAAARTLVQDDPSVYGRVTAMLLGQTAPATSASKDAAHSLAIDAVESQRSRIDRFMPTLSTIITAAPLLGILGTVTGLMQSLSVLSQQTASTDPRSVGTGIAEALITTAAGLTVALVVLFPYNAFRAQIDRTLGRIEMLIAAAGAAGEGVGSRE